MNRFTPGNRLTLLRNGAEYFPALEKAIDAARREIWFESYIFADDAAGRRIAAAFARAAQRGVHVRVLIDAWGAKYYMTASLEREMTDAGVRVLKGVFLLNLSEGGADEKFAAFGHRIAGIDHQVD